MDKLDLINSIKKNYKMVQEMKIENAQAFAVSIRSSLEFAVKLFWQEKFEKCPYGNLIDSINDSHFSKVFERWTITYMHLIRQDCNDIIHGKKDLTVSTAKELIENLEKCLKAIEQKLGVSIISVMQREETKQQTKTITKNNHSSNGMILQKTKNVVLRFMQKQPYCEIMARGLTQADIFRCCGFSWGQQENATVSNQQYWIVACLKELESEQLVQQDVGTKFWRLTKNGETATVDVSEFSGLKFSQVGEKIREQSKHLVLSYMKSNSNCARYGKGLRQAELFRLCGFDWGDYEKAESPRQQYWLVGLLRTLENEGLIQRDGVSKKWRMV